MYKMPFVVSVINPPLGTPMPVAFTPGVVSAIAKVGAVPVSELSATRMGDTARLASAPANVKVIVPMPLVTVPAAVVTLPVPIFESASSAVSILETSVASTDVQVIAAVVRPSNDKRKVPPVGVPPIVKVCTSSVPAPGAPAFE